jgi:purine-binding chemotaxis protein CheW
MEKQFVIFSLGKEQFGFEIEVVETIVKMQEITNVPYTPAFVEGVTNLRGTVLPVIDLAKRFGMKTEAQTAESRIIVVIINGLKIGVVVSTVEEVLSIDDSQVEDTPPLICTTNSDFITGIAKIDTRLVTLLDVARILSKEEEESLEKTVK